MSPAAFFKEKTVSYWLDSRWQDRVYCIGQLFFPSKPLSEVQELYINRLSFKAEAYTGYMFSSCRVCRWRQDNKDIQIQSDMVHTLLLTCVPLLLIGQNTKACRAPMASQEKLSSLGEKGGKSRQILTQYCFHVNVLEFQNHGKHKLYESKMISKEKIFQGFQTTLAYFPFEIIIYCSLWAANWNQSERDDIIHFSSHKILNQNRIMMTSGEN